MLAGDTGGAPQWQSVGEFGFGNTLGTWGFYTPFLCRAFSLFFDFNHGPEMGFRYHMQRI